MILNILLISDVLILHKFSACQNNILFQKRENKNLSSTASASRRLNPKMISKWMKHCIKSFLICLSNIFA